MTTANTQNSNATFNIDPLLLFKQYVKYKPHLKAITGTDSSALLLSRLINYSEYNDLEHPEREGWFCRYQEEFAIELEIAHSTAKRCYSTLYKLDILETYTESPDSYERPLTWYRLNLDRVRELTVQYFHSERYAKLTEKAKALQKSRSAAMKSTYKENARVPWNLPSDSKNSPQTRMVEPKSDPYTQRQVSQKHLSLTENSYKQKQEEENDSGESLAQSFANVDTEKSSNHDCVQNEHRAQEQPPKTRKVKQLYTLEHLLEYVVNQNGYADQPDMIEFCRAKIAAHMAYMTQHNHVADEGSANQFVVNGVAMAMQTQINRGVIGDASHNAARAAAAALNKKAARTLNTANAAAKQQPTHEELTDSSNPMEHDFDEALEQFSNNGIDDSLDFENDPDLSRDWAKNISIV